MRCPPTCENDIKRFAVWTWTIRAAGHSSYFSLRGSNWVCGSWGLLFCLVKCGYTSRMSPEIMMIIFVVVFAVLILAVILRHADR